MSITNDKRQWTDGYGELKKDNAKLRENWNVKEKEYQDRLTAFQNETIRVTGLLRVANTKINDMKKELYSYRQSIGNGYRNYLEECNILLKSKNEYIEELKVKLYDLEAGYKIFRKNYCDAIEACDFMREDNSLNLSIGASLTTDGVKALKAQRDALQTRVGDLADKVANINKWNEEQAEMIRNLHDDISKLKGCQHQRKRDEDFGGWYCCQICGATVRA
jgi:chromosome segregation ATPase